MGFFSMFGCAKGSDRKNKVKNDTKWRIFSLKELHSATNKFNYDNKLGEGEVGSVYWGQLWDGSQIAVKRFKSWSDEADTEFSIEIEVLARVRHKYLLKLRGYCAEGQERLIVYDYMSNMSLQSHLHGQHSAAYQLDWTRRMNIAIGAAEGIAHLHHNATPHIIHRDIKPSNILLDSDFNPQVSDFLISKFIPKNSTHVTPNAKGYLAPEFAASGKASESCDVYSFGVLLLELVSGKRPVEKLSSTAMRAIADWALPLAREGKFGEIVDERLNGSYVEEELRCVVLVGLVCSSGRPEKRPTMIEVVEMLKGDKEKLGVLENDDMFKRGLVDDSGVEDEERQKQEIGNVQG